MDDISSSKTLQCPNGHTFCRDCLRRVYKHNEHSEVLTCPLCRTMIDSNILKLRSMRAPKGGAIVTLQIGNTHVDAGDGLHRWECFVDVVGIQSRRRGGDSAALRSLVSAVIFELHPTFEPPRVTITAQDAIEAQGGAPRFSVVREGWGTFVVRIQIVFCGSYRIEYKHRLSFDGDGSALKERRVEIGPRVMALVEKTLRLSRPLSRTVVEAGSTS